MRTRLLPILSALAITASAQTQNSKFIAAVDEYVPAPGQFINVLPEAAEDDTPESMAQKCTSLLAGNSGGLVSLGAYGGYITFHFDHPIVNLPGQYDIYIKGNSFAGSSEPGIVMVSQDTNGNGLPDDEWYELSGSADTDSTDKVIYNYEVTYTRAAMQDVPWTDNCGGAGKVERNIYHNQEYYPLWLGETLTFRGTRLPGNGYDRSGNGTYWVLDALRYGYVDNLPNTDSIGNSFDIGWAVDGMHQPAALTHIDFVRVYCAMQQMCGWLGETSTEIAGAEDLHLAASLSFAAATDTPTARHTRPTTIYGLDGTRRRTLRKGINIIDGKIIIQ